MRGSHLLALMASTSALAMAAPAFAADASQPNTVQQVTVTAEKRSEAIKDVPMSVSALPQEQLEKLNAVDFQDYAKLVPGLSVEESGPGASRLTLRGLNAGGVASTVAVYVDESPFGSSSGLVNGAVLAGDFDTFDMSRVEVLRGPQGTLYGSNTEGGLVKFVSNAPSMAGYAGAMKFGVDGVAHGGTGWGADGMFNAPLGDKAAIRVSGFHEEIPGYIDNAFNGLTNVNSGRKDGGRISFLWAPSEKFSLRLTAFGQDMTFQGYPMETVDAVTLKPLYGKYMQSREIPEPNFHSYRNYNATANWDLGFANLMSSTSWGTLHSHYQQDDSAADFLPFFTGGDLASLYSGIFGGPATAALGFHNSVNDDKFTEELRLTSPKAEHFEWQIGGYYTHEKGVISQDLYVAQLNTGDRVSVVPSLEVPGLVSTYDESAVFVDGTYHFTPQFDIQLGGRYSNQRQAATETITGLLVGGGPIVFKDNSDNNVFTWSVGPRWHVTENTMVYGRVATGYRPGGPNVLPPNPPPGTPQTYNADRNTSYEAGVKTTLDDGKLSVDAAIYYIQWDNIQLFEVVNGFGVNGNGGKATSQGAEWALAWRPVSGLSFIFNGAYTDAKLTTNAPGVNALSGEPLPWVPKWSWGLDGEYSWAAFGDNKAFIGGTWGWQSDTRSDFDSAGDPRVKLPSYSTVDLRGGVEFGRARLEVYAKNVGDVHAFTSMSGIISAGLDQREGSLITPRTIGVSVSTKW